MYKVITKTLTFNKPGLSPTVKNGTDMGYVLPGLEFTAGAYVNGWLSITPNRWVMASACKEITVTPPIDPPTSKEVVQIRYGTKTGDVITWDGTGRQYEEL